MTIDHDPRLYLIVPSRIAADTLAAALDGGDVACVLLCEPGGGAKDRVRAAQNREVAVLVPDDPQCVQELDADGLHLGTGGDAKAVRKRLGPERILGVACGNSRHDGMLAGEAGADYVAFSGRDDRPAHAADTATLGWWQAMMTVPCVATGRIALGDVGDLARAGADFVALDEAVWEHPDGPAEAVAEANRRLDAAKAGRV